MVTDDENAAGAIEAGTMSDRETALRFLAEIDGGLSRAPLPVPGSEECYAGIDVPVRAVEAAVRALAENKANPQQASRDVIAERRRWQRLCEAATGGPWEEVPQNGAGPIIAHRYDTGNQMQPTGLRLICHVLQRGNSLKQDKANAAFIAAARSVMPELLAENARLTMRVNMLLRELGRAPDPELAEIAGLSVDLTSEEGMKIITVMTTEREKTLIAESVQLTKERDQSMRDANRWLVAYSAAKDEIRRLREALEQVRPFVADSVAEYIVNAALIPPDTSQEGGGK